jgi:hypothetical protein
MGYINSTLDVADSAISNTLVGTSVFSPSLFLRFAAVLVGINTTEREFSMEYIHRTLTALDKILTFHADLHVRSQWHVQRRLTGRQV